MPQKHPPARIAVSVWVVISFISISGVTLQSTRIVSEFARLPATGFAPLADRLPLADTRFGERLFKVRNLVCPFRPAEQEALGVRATAGTHEFQMLGRLN